MGSDFLASLIEGLRSPSAKVREQSAAKLGQFGPIAAPAVPDLVNALSDGNQSVRCQSATALAKIGPDAESAIPALSRALRNRDECEPVRSQAALALAKIGPTSLPALIEGLGARRDAFQRQESAWAIGKMGPSGRAAVPALIQSLGDDDNHVQANAIDSLVSIGAASVGLLEQGLSSTHLLIRANAGRVLLKIDPTSRAAINSTITLIKNENDQVRISAILALRSADRTSAAETVPVFAAALKDPDDFVRQIAAESLSDLGPDAKAATPSLIEGLNDPFFHVRGLCAVALGKIGPEAKSAVPALIKNLHDEEEDVCVLTARSLGHFGPYAKSAIPALKEMLRGGDLRNDLRQAVEATLNRIPNEDPNRKGGRTEKGT